MRKTKCLRRRLSQILTSFPPWNGLRRPGLRQASEGWPCLEAEYPWWFQLCTVSIRLKCKHIKTKTGWLFGLNYGKSTFTFICTPLGELFCTLLEAPAGDSLNKGMSLLWGYLLMKRFQMASMGHHLECSPVERKGNNYFPLVRSDTSKVSTEELLGTGTKNVNMSNMNKKI